MPKPFFHPFAQGRRMSAHIRFLCPTCKAVMEAPVGRAGQKINCLKCGQRLQIPPEERAKTILAPSLGIHEEGQPVSLPRPSSVPIAQVAALPPSPLPPRAMPAPPIETGELHPPVTLSLGQAIGTFLRWVWRDRHFRVVASVAAGMLVVGCTWWVGLSVIGWAWPRVVGPTASVQGKTWSNKELIDHLHRNGLTFKTRVISANEIPLRDLPLNQRHLLEWETVVIAYPENESNVEMAAVTWGFKLLQQRPDLVEAMQAKDNTRLHEALRGSGIFFFSRAKSADKVKESIRNATQELLINEEAIHSWGLFVFVGDPDEIAKIRKIL
jgi:hypothetical protein